MISISFLLNLFPPVSDLNCTRMTNFPSAFCSSTPITSGSGAKTMRRNTCRLVRASALEEIGTVITELGLGKVIAGTQTGASSWASTRTFTTDAGMTYFAKISREDELMFRGEAASLRALFRTGTIRVPEVIHTSKLSTVNASYIIMEKLNLQSVFGMSQLGRAVAELHLAPPVLPEAQAGKFGFEVDNTIGSTLQPNGWMDNWIDFYRERRLRHQANLTRDRGGVRDELVRWIKQCFLGWLPRTHPRSRGIQEKKEAVRTLPLHEPSQSIWRWLL